MNVEKRLIEGNQKFIQRIEKDNYKKEHLTNLVKSQNPFAMVITCSDSRVIPENIFSLKEGELFVIRSAGNVINEGELASIEYGIEHLHIKYILVLGHTHCGAIHAAFHHEKGHYLSPILSKIERCLSSSELETTKANALKQAKCIKEKFRHYDGTISSGIYDIETNKVEIF